MKKNCLLLLAILILICSCTHQSSFVNRKAIHSKKRHVAVLPFINFTAYSNAGKIVSDILNTELYRQTNFKIMDQTAVFEKLNKEGDFLDQVLEK